LGDWKLDAALGSCLLLGLRHGFDYDHLAAISDITAVQRNWRSGLRLGMTYALGHAFTVAVLGIAVRRAGAVDLVHCFHPSLCCILSADCIGHSFCASRRHRRNPSMPTRSHLWLGTS